MDSTRGRTYNGAEWRAVLGDPIPVDEPDLAVHQEESIGMVKCETSEASINCSSILYMTDVILGEPSMEFEIKDEDQSHILEEEYSDGKHYTSYKLQKQKHTHSTYKKRFVHEWLNEPKFKDWLEDTLIPGLVKCKVCRKQLQSGKTELLRHASTTKHRRKMSEYNALKTHNIVSQKIVDLRGICPPITRRTMSETVALRPADEEVPTFEDLEIKLAATLGKDDAILVPSVHLANLIAVSTYNTMNGSSCIAGENSRIHQWSEAYDQYDVKWYTDLPIHPPTDQIVSFLDTNKRHVICIENTHNFGGGLPTSLEWIQEVARVSQKYDADLHMDGTGLLDASLSESICPREYCKAFTSVTFDFGGPTLAILAGSDKFIDMAKKSPFLHTLDPVDAYLAIGCHTAAKNQIRNTMKTHSIAKTIAAAVDAVKCPYVSVDLTKTLTNVVHLHCHGISPAELVSLLSRTTTREQADLEEPLIIKSLVQDSSNVVSLVPHACLTEACVQSIVEKLTFVLSRLPTSTSISYEMKVHF